MLAERILELAPEVLPLGRRVGHFWEAGSVAGERGHSLKVYLSGPRKGRWADYAVTTLTSDALDLVREALFPGDMTSALSWSRRWLGLPDTGAVTEERRRAMAAERTRSKREADAEAAAKRRKAREIFFGRPSAIMGTPTWSYLLQRVPPLAELPHLPRALRFHPALWCQEVRQPLPTMLGAIVGLDGQVMAVHRTWLQQDEAGAWRKARLESPKKVLAPMRGGHIALWRGQSNLPLGKGPPSETIAIAEGIETALAVACAVPELRVIAAVSLGNMAAVELPPSVSAVILCADNDGDDNVAAAAALQRAVDAHHAAGRDVRIARSPLGKDFADCLAAGDAS